MKKTIKHNQTTLAYHIQGTGPTLTLLHGFMEDHTIWDTLLPTLTRTNTVITIDLPGHGDSQNLAQINTMDHIAQAIKTIFDHEHIEQTVLIGHSMGGYITLSYAEQYPQTLRGIGLFHSNAHADSPQAQTNRLRAVSLIEQNKTNYILQFIPDLFEETNRARLADQIHTLQQKAATLPATSLIAAQHGMRLRPDRTHVLTDTNLPVLFIIGKQDPRTPLDTLLHQATLPKHAEVLTLSPCGHMSHLEQPQASGDFIQSFTQHCYR